MESKQAHLFVVFVTVPMSVIASWKKIKSLGANNQMLIKALRTSTKLVSSYSICIFICSAVRVTSSALTPSSFWFNLLLQVVSEDGKKVRRKQLFTERDKEELQVSNTGIGLAVIWVSKDHNYVI